VDLTSSTSLEDVKAVLVETLGIEHRAASVQASTPLLGDMPELDSLAVVELVSALEARFGFTVDDDEISGDVFETVGSLAAFVDAKRPDAMRA
jgi:acyl carrier protein